MRVNLQTGDEKINVDKISRSFASDNLKGTADVGYNRIRIDMTGYNRS